MFVSLKSQPPDERLGIRVTVRVRNRVTLGLGFRFMVRVKG